jgi:hypothetical protein
VKRDAIAAMTWLAVLASGCGRSQVESELLADGHGQAADEGALAGAGGGGAGARSGSTPVNPLRGGAAGAASTPVVDAAVRGSSSAGASAAPIDGPATAFEPTQVWIGQLWSIEPVLCDPNAPWSDTPVVFDPKGYIERVVLVLDLRDDPARPLGVIAFGQGELPAVPDIPQHGDGGSFWLCSNQIPSKGGEYTLIDAQRSNARLTFDIVPGEIWNASCPGGDSSACHCKDGCAIEPGHSIPLDLLVTGDDMQGRFHVPSGELRLRRVE